MPEQRTSYWGLIAMGGMMLLISAVLIWAYYTDALPGLRSHQDVQEFKQEQATKDLLPVVGTAPHFTYTTHLGDTITPDSLKGSIYVVDFFFTRCSNECPIMTSSLGKVQQAYPIDPTIKIVSFSIDPENDTPELLMQYAARNQIDTTRWYLLRGEQQATFDLAKEGYLTSAGLVDGEIDHSSRMTLVDPLGKVRGTYIATTEGEIDRLIEDIAKLKNEFQL